MNPRCPLLVYYGMSNKITIIGLGLVGNSIGMGLRRALKSAGSSTQIVGFDPVRSAEEAALRKHMSVDSVAPDLQSAVSGADTVIICTPASAVREVLGAMAPFLDEGTTVTDTLSLKGPVMAWAGELLGKGVSFVGGHPLSRKVDLETASGETPGPDLFDKAPWSIMPLPSASSDALNNVINIAQLLGARPLFIDPYEHDSFFTAVSYLPSVASAALLRITASSPSWQDIGTLARGQFRSMAEPLAADPDTLAEALTVNRQVLLHWIDQYMLALHDMREMLASPANADALRSTLEDAFEARARWLQDDRDLETDDPMAGRRPEMDERLRSELSQAIDDSKPGRRILGRYLGDRVFGGKRDDK